MAAANEPAPTPGTVPVGPVLSIFDQIYLGIDEYGEPVYIDLIERNLLAGGEPGAGKSNFLSNIVAHAALCTDVRLCLIDGKRVELGLWRDIADVFVGPDINHANRTLQRLLTVIDNRYAFLEAKERRKIERSDTFSPILVVIDEIAYFSTVAGLKRHQEEFVTLLRDTVNRGRAVGVIVVAATQRPSVDIIPGSLRDQFAWRFAARTNTDVASDIILGDRWSTQGYTARSIDPNDRGVGYLIAEGGTPRLIRAAYLSDEHIKRLADYARWIRRPAGLPDATPTAPTLTRFSRSDLEAAA